MVGVGEMWYNIENGEESEFLYYRAYRPREIDDRGSDDGDYGYGGEA